MAKKNWIDTGLDFLGIGSDGFTAGDLLAGAKAVKSYFDEDDGPGTFSTGSGGVNLKGKIKTTVSTPRSAKANKISKSPITSQAEATVNKHRAILARALSQAVSITSKSKRT